MIRLLKKTKHQFTILNTINEFKHAEQLFQKGQLQDSYQMYQRVHQIIKQFDIDAAILLNQRLAKLSHLINQSYQYNTDHHNPKLNVKQYLKTIIDLKPEPVLQDYQNYCVELIKTDLDEMLQYLQNIDTQYPDIQQHLQLLHADCLVCNGQFDEAAHKYRLLFDSDQDYVKAVSFNNSMVALFFQPIDQQFIQQNIDRFHNSIKLVDDIDIEQLQAAINNQDTQLSLQSSTSRQIFLNLVRFLFIIDHPSFNLHLKNCLSILDDKQISKALTLMAVKCASQQQYIKAEGLFRKSLENKEPCYDRLFCLQQYAYMLKQLDRETEATNYQYQIQQLQNQLPKYSQQLECLVIPQPLF